MKRSPLIRRIGLRRGTSLRFRSRRMARLYRLRRKFVGAFLDGRQCEGRRVIPGECFGAMTVHEAIRRSALGEIIPGPKADAQGQRFHALCAGHHDYVTTHSAWAKRLGFSA